MLRGRLAFGLLAIHGTWSGLAYHWLFFRSINPAAATFAVLFLLQAAVFAWLAVSGCGAILVRLNLRGVLGAGLALYGLA